MTLGSGALHSELNASEEEPMRFIQIWILLDTPNLSPNMEQKVLTKQDRHNRLLEVLSPGGGDAVMVHQDVYLYIAFLDDGVGITDPIGRGRGLNEPGLTITAHPPSELVLVDVPLKFGPVGVWKNRF